MRPLAIISLILILTTWGCSGDDPIPVVTAPWAGDTVSCCCDDTLRVLLVGNSFAQDAVDQYLDSLLDDAGVVYCIGRLHLESASLEMHLDNILSGASVYDYRCYTPDTVVHRSRVSLADALQERPWGVVSVQQVSGKSAVFKSYRSYLPRLVRQLRYYLPADAKIALHVTWSYPRQNHSKEFKPYRYDPELMYRAIIEAASRAEALECTDMTVPTGTAIQIARADEVLNADCRDLCRDDRHLNFGAGRFVAALTWYEALTGKPATESTFRPSALSDDAVRRARRAVHKAFATERCLLP